MDSKKSNKIRDIVRLQQILKKWRKLANSSMKTSTASSSNGGSSTKGIKFLKRTLSLSESCYVRESTSSSSSNMVPKGYLAVSVGEDMQRFIIPTEYLGHSAFHVLLREAEEEFGFQQTGVLRIPCQVAVFKSILKLVDGKKDVFLQDYCRSGLDDSGSEGGGYCSLITHRTPSHHHHHHPQSPICS